MVSTEKVEKVVSEPVLKGWVGGLVGWSQWVPVGGWDAQLFLTLTAKARAGQQLQARVQVATGGDGAQEEGAGDVDGRNGPVCGFNVGWVVLSERVEWVEWVGGLTKEQTCPALEPWTLPI